MDIILVQIEIIQLKTRGLQIILYYTMGRMVFMRKFYRTYDNLLRNSMHPVKGDILLSDHQKMNIPAHRKVIIEGQELFVDST